MLRTLAVAFLIPVFSSAQWTDVKPIGTGGESFVAVDGKGNVYVTAHQPGQLLTSRDFGDTFGKPFTFKDALGDFHVVTWGEGRVHVTYMSDKVDGIQSWFSKDAGRNLIEGDTFLGPYDREWIAVNPKTNEVYFDYSDGYIGGPDSKGIYFAASADGKTFVRRSRIDNEPIGHYAVDPYLTNTPEGKLYAAWEVSSDKDTIDSFGFAMSDDGGKTWKHRQRIAEIHKKLGDTQERWMLGGILAVGEDTVIVYYPDYAEVGSAHPLLLHYRMSKDGGATFGDARTLLPRAEIEKAVQEYVRKSEGENFPLYIQSLAWMCADPSGNVHAVFQDNRSGQTMLKDEALNQWSVRYTTLAKGQEAFSESEKVSRDYTARRPPLDFMSCAADSTRLYVTWTESTHPDGDWEFSGKLMLGRKKFGGQ